MGVEVEVLVLVVLRYGTGRTPRWLPPTADPLVLYLVLGRAVLMDLQVGQLLLELLGHDEGEQGQEECSWLGLGEVLGGLVDELES